MRYAIVSTPIDPALIPLAVETASSARRSLDGTSAVLKFEAAAERDPAVQALSLLSAAEVRTVLAGPEWTAPEES